MTPRQFKEDHAANPEKYKKHSDLSKFFKQQADPVLPALRVESDPIPVPIQTPKKK